ncbi:hypothetical protein MKC44_20755 [[Clostridium] innocuum]|nr:hypothetical protein [[Clostridium] innocuum]
MHFHKLRIRISLLWLPYLLMLPYLPVARLIGWIFIMLTIHEMAHMLCAIQTVDKVTVDSLFKI